MSFVEIAEVENPGIEELSMFVKEVNNFLGYVIESKDFNFLWENQTNLRELAIATYHENISTDVNELINVIPEISKKKIHQHGLVGLPAKFKYNVVATIEQREPQVKLKESWIKRQLSKRKWLKKIFEAIDAILDSIIAAAGGAGGLVMEFKKALSALT